MARMVSARKGATYADVLAAPEHQLAELIAGELVVQPRPAMPHVSTASDLGGLLMGPFRFGRGGPGGWVILFEPELHLGGDVLVPDFAGWRTERFPKERNVPFLSVTPDWICEVLSPSTLRHDRVVKMPIYAAAGVEHAWLVDPVGATLEAYRRSAANWLLLGTWSDQDVAPIPPFEAVPLELGLLWPDRSPV